ncbi:hypothetical protein B0H19DRAFT_1068817 [Mycena capillaripes]|nr:hypothetical protein B0H19DRAFT_1068817 [Mycena capillaripes]
MAVRSANNWRNFSPFQLNKGALATLFVNKLSVWVSRQRVQSVRLIRYNGDNIQFSGEVRLWDMNTDPDCTVWLQWNDRVGGTSTSASRRHTAAWYSFSVAEDIPSLTLDAAAGITNLRFVVDGKLEDQGGVGFVVQDDLMFSASSCFTSEDTSISGHIDVAVRSGIAPTRVYLEVQVRDETNCPIVVEVNIVPPAAVDDTAVYAIWSAVIQPDKFNVVLYSIGAEIDGVKFAMSEPL